MDDNHRQALIEQREQIWADEEKARTHVCSKCNSPLVMPYDPLLKRIVLRCPNKCDAGFVEKRWKNHGYGLFERVE